METNEIFDRVDRALEQAQNILRTNFAEMEAMRSKMYALETENARLRDALQRTRRLSAEALGEI